MIHLTKGNFNETVKNAGCPVLVDFWAEWCGPCRMMAPILESLDRDANGRVIIGKVDVDAERELAAQFGIVSIPTLIIFRDGVETDRLVGVRPAEALKGALGI